MLGDVKIRRKYFLFTKCIMAGVVLLSFVLVLMTSVLHMSGAHLKSESRQLAHGFMLVTDIVALVALLSIYGKTKKIYVLSPLLLALINYFHYGHNCTDYKEGDGTSWGFMNGMVLSILGMQI